MDAINAMPKPASRACPLSTGSKTIRNCGRADMIHCAAPFASNTPSNDPAMDANSACVNTT